MSLRELYQDMIVDHGRQPRNFGQLTHPNHSQIGHNPLCGDRLTLYINMHEGKINQIKFEGTGCAISVASASLMTEAVQGKSREEIEKLFSQFHTLVTTGSESDHDIGKLAVFIGVAAFPVRVKCATLAWHTLNAALHNKPHPITTE